MPESLYRELREEAADFFEDFREFFFHVRRHKKKIRNIAMGGVVVQVRLAYIFAKRIDSLLKIVFGLSIFFSAITASFVGFTKLSELLDVLMFTIVGRVLMGIIGLAMLLTAVWTLVDFSETRKAGPKESVETA